MSAAGLGVEEKLGTLGKVGLAAPLSSRLNRLEENFTQQGTWFMMRAALLSGVFALFTAAAASAQAPIEISLPVDSYVDVCGEMVSFEGTLHISLRSQTDEGGGFHLRIRQWNDVDGVGDNGARYRVNFSANQTIQVREGGLPISETVTANEVIVGKGQAPNLRLKQAFKFVVNANGDVSVEDGTFDLVCQ